MSVSRCISRRRCRPLLLAAVLTQAAACAGSPATLNSDRIEQRFGSYGVEILEASPGRRVSSLYSLQGDTRICRTYAVVEFSLPVADAIAGEHRLVESGKSIGAVFRDAGWEIEKHTLFVGAAPPSADAGKIAGLMRVAGSPTLAMHRYRFVIVRDTERIRYATISEIHHPAYMSVRELLRVHGGTR